MTASPSRRSVLSLGLALIAASATSACAGPKPRPANLFVENTALNPGETPHLRALIDKYAREYQMPPTLLHRMIKRESGYNPAARNGPYYGLLQIHPRTAATMGFSGTPERLLDPEVNLKYAGKYLRGAWLVSDGSQDRAESWYANGYYYEAKRRGLLKQTGLKG